MSHTTLYLHYISRLLTAKMVQKCSLLVTHIDTPNKVRVLLLRKKNMDLGLATSCFCYIITGVA